MALVRRFAPLNRYTESNPYRGFELLPSALADEGVMPPSVSVPSSEMRFEFGENWTRFLALVNDQRILQAEKSLQNPV